MTKGFFSKPTGTGVTPLPSQPNRDRMAEGSALRAERLKEEGIRSVELTTPGPVITTPGISVGFDLDRSKFEDGVASVHNFSGGEFELLIASSTGSVQVDGQQVEINTWIPLRGESTEILFGEHAKVTVRPLALPDDPDAPSGDS
jgi:hypothetical protein